jgi:3D (Asp-Asp-Asp) domain-containing protein
LKVKSIFRGSAAIGTALLSCSLIFSARTSSAEPLTSQAQEQASKQNQPLENSAVVLTETAEGSLGQALVGNVTEQTAAAPASAYVATAYSLRGRTASGRPVSKGLIAADPRFLPLGSRVKLEAGTYSGEYLVADTGGAVRGRRIDIWTPTSREAMSFGKRVIKLTVLSYGGKRKASHATTK